MLSDWESLRASGTGNLFGVFSPKGPPLLGIVSLRLSDDFVAEFARWNTQEGRDRPAFAEGASLITSHGHQGLGLIRIWAVIDPVDDRYSKYLGFVGVFSLEGEVRTPGGEVKVRYSSIG